jgi:AcrR family transcriptional regulator
MEQKQKQIQRAAQALFLEQGFERTTMDAISTTAHVSKQTLYRYYSSKEQLFAGILVTFTHLETLPYAPDSAVAFTNHAEFKQVLHHVAGEIITRLMEPDYLAFVRVVITESSRLPQVSSPQSYLQYIASHSSY